MEKLKGHKIFLIDAMGALISLLFLLFLYAFEAFFGMPGSVLIIFICIATIFFIYSATTYLIRPANWQFYLKIIAVLNISYCLFTVYHIIQNSESLTSYGYAYFIIEILVIVILATYELKSARTKSIH